MRKQLLAGTALVAAAVFAAGGAAAQGKKMMKPSISVNGYYETVVGGMLDDTQETKYTTRGSGRQRRVRQPRRRRDGRKAER